jgi:hypothetical protein
MALELEPETSDEYAHSCPLPWPADPEAPEGHVCECGRRWVYQPAHWDPLLTLDELRLRQGAGAFLRGIVPRFRPPPERVEGVIVHISPATGKADDLPS